MVIFHILKEQGMKFSVLASISVLYSLTKSNCNILVSGAFLSTINHLFSTFPLQMIIPPSLKTPEVNSYSFTVTAFKTMPCPCLASQATPFFLKRKKRLRKYFCYYFARRYYLCYTNELLYF